MGCDIHAYKEIKVKGKWHFAGPAPISRRYGVFGVMAGGAARGEDDGLGFAPKGMPKDASAALKACRKDYGEDGHTDSYLTSDELVKLRAKFDEWAKKPAEPGMEKFKEKEDWYLKEFGDIDRYTPLMDFMKERESYKDDEYKPCAWIEDVRLVFWFDN